MVKRTSNPKAARRRGVALVVTLAVVLAIAALAIVFARQMQTEVLGARNAQSAAAARQLAEGVVRAVVADLWTPVRAGELPAAETLEVDAARLGDGIYWILRPDFENDALPGFGLVGEGGKLDLNVVDSDTLQGLPGVTPDVADAIVDWRDADDEVGADGAESAYYVAQWPAHLAKNDGFETVEELGLVRGLDDTILHGEDNNRSGVLDDAENDGAASETENESGEPVWADNVADNRDGTLDRGLVDYVTAWGDGENEDAVDLGQASPPEIQEALAAVLTAERATAIAGQLAGPGNRSTSLLGAYLSAGVTAEEQALLAGKVTLGATAGPGDAAAPVTVVDVFSASPVVLDALPEMEAGDGDRLVAARLAGGAPEKSLTWVADVLGEDKARAVGPSLTSYSRNFSANIVAISGDGRAFCRLRVVVDASEANATTPPKVVYRRDLTALGWPLDPQIVADLRGGLSADDVSRRYATGATP